MVSERTSQLARPIRNWRPTVRHWRNCSPASRKPSSSCCNRKNGGHRPTCGRCGARNQ
jgi:hypothetical protein